MSSLFFNSIFSTTIIVVMDAEVSQKQDLQRLTIIVFSYIPSLTDKSVGFLRKKNDIIFLILSTIFVFYLLYDHNLMINNRRMPLFSVLMLRKKYWKMARTLGWSLTLKVWIQMTPSASFPMRRASLCYSTWRLCLGVQVRVETYTVLNIFF